MLGFDALGREAIGQLPIEIVVVDFIASLSTPIRRRNYTAQQEDFFGATAQTGENIFEDKWHFPWSEPVRIKPRALMAASGYFGSLGAGTFEIIYEDKWHFAWSEPIVKTKAGLATSRQQFIAWQPNTFTKMDWFNPLHDPVRVKLGLRAGLQTPLFEVYQQSVLLEWFMSFSEPARKKRGVASQVQPFFNFQPTPIINVSWIEKFSEPVRKKPRLLDANQQFFQFFPNPLVNFSWFDNLSDPVRVKPRLREGSQVFLIRAEFIPINYDVRLDATETRDFLLAVLYQFNVPATAYVDIISKDPMHLGNVGVIENTAQSIIVPRARVAIITG